MIRYWKVLILAACVLLAVLAVGFKPSAARSGVEVAFVSQGSPFSQVVKQGAIITSVNDIPIKNINDWESAKNLKGQIKMIANGIEESAFVNDTLGIDVLNVQRLNLDFGLDIRGGTRIILKPKGEATKETIENVKSVLQTRANIYGLKEIRFKIISDISGNNLLQIEASGVGSDVINGLLARAGKFEAKVSRVVELIDDKGEFLLSGNKYPIKSMENNSIEIDGRKVNQGGEFELGGISFEYSNRSSSSILLLAKVYQGKDIELVQTDAQRSGVLPTRGGYRFFFGVLVSKTGAERFAKVTDGVESSIDLAGSDGDGYLRNSEIFLYLDDELITTLRISSDLAGTPQTNPQITGGRPTKDEALKEKTELQTILRSGATPVGLEIVSVDVISPTLGVDFLRSAFFSAALAALGVFAVVMFRYRKLKIALPMVFVSLSEVLIIVGVAATGDTTFWGIAFVLNLAILLISWSKKQEVDIFSWLGALSIPLLGMSLSWTIDLPAIGGIIAAIGTGIDHQVIIADETLSGEKRRILSVKDKIKTAFTIIFGAAATIIVAMAPLIFLVAEFVRGFALTTIIGVWIGISLTRPAYAMIVEEFNKQPIIQPAQNQQQAQ